MERFSSTGEYTKAKTADGKTKTYSESPDGTRTSQISNEKDGSYIKKTENAETGTSTFEQKTADGSTVQVTDNKHERTERVEDGKSGMWGEHVLNKATGTRKSSYGDRNGQIGEWYEHKT